MMRNPEKLTCISIIICDCVYRDETTKKLAIIGTFNRVKTTSLPFRLSRMTVLFTVTNGKGDYDVSLSIVHEESGHEVIQMRGPMAIKDPLAISEINVELKNLIFPAGGKYWVELKADGAVLQQRPFLVEVHLRPNGN